MDIFKPSTLSWWQVGLVKVCLLSLGIAIGAYWQEVFLPYVSILVAVGIALGVYLAVVAFRQH